MIKSIRHRNTNKNLINGWLIIDKPAGLTSNKVIQRIKNHIKPKKIGHAGTLDPDATGVLPVAMGEATKVIPYLMSQNKTYVSTIKFGIKTDTDDVSGKILKRSNYRPTKREISEALKYFSGQIYQKPPIVSAVKVNGSRAYKLFHLGQHISLKSRKLLVSNIKIISQLDTERCSISFACGKGGYVRSIARDIGDFLGCFGCVETLSRTSYGHFEIEDSIKLENLLNISLEEVKNLTLGMEKGFSHLKFFECLREDYKKLENGIPIKNIYDQTIKTEDEVVAFFEGRPICILICKNTMLKPKRKFNLD